MTVLTITDLLGIDFDDKGLAETIDSVTEALHEMNSVFDAIGRAIFFDGALLEDDELNPNEFMKKIAFGDERVMKMLCYYASRSDEFMNRLKG